MQKLKITVFLFVLLLLVFNGAAAHADVCDVDSDGDVDRADIDLIFDARNTPASGPYDPRDADGNGIINVLDGRQCVQHCSFAGCTPHIVGAVEVPSKAEGVAVSGNYAYVADRDVSKVIDISDPSNPTIVRAVDTPEDASDVAVSGHYAYVTDWDEGLQVIDISGLD